MGACLGPDNKTVLTEMYAWLCSLRFTITLLLAIALLSVVGTLLPQGPLPPEYIAHISPERLSVYSRLGLFDMYHSWWFIALLFLFSLNLVCCSIKRLPHVIDYIRSPQLIHNADSSSASALEAGIEHHQGLEHASAVVFELLKQSYPYTAKTAQDGQVHLFAQKNSWGRLGVYVVHFSILLIFAGAIVGALFGFKGYMLLAEGEQSGVVDLDGRQRELGFSIRCDSFTVEHYPNGAPRTYRSVLTVQENGKVVEGYAGVKVVVNEPLEYRGIRFYQANYGSAGRFYFNVSTPDGKMASIEVNGEDAARLPDGSHVRVLETTQDVSMYYRQLNGAAAVLEIASPDGRVDRLVSFAEYPELNLKTARDANRRLIFDYKGERMYTGLKVVKDPGVWLVWCGCIMMLAGMLVAFFMPHKRVWVVLSDGRADVYGHSSKNATLFRTEFQRMAEAVRTSLTTMD